MSDPVHAFRVVRRACGIRIETPPGDVVAYRDLEGTWHLKNTWSLPDAAFGALYELVRQLDRQKKIS